MADTDTNVQLNKQPTPVKAGKTSTNASAKVHIKVPAKAEPTKPVEAAPTVEATIPQSILVTKEKPDEVEPTASETVPQTTSSVLDVPQEPPPPEKLFRNIMLTDEDLIERAGDDKILYILRRLNKINEILAFHSSQLLAFQPDPLTPSERSILIKAVADVGHAHARLDTHALQIKDIQDGHTDSKAIMSGRASVQIKDKTTGKIYKSKNNTYQSLLKDGSLKELVDLGVFGDDPAKNSFGWYQLKRAFPDRFEEITDKNPVIEASIEPVP